MPTKAAYTCIELMPHIKSKSHSRVLIRCRKYKSARTVLILIARVLQKDKYHRLPILDWLRKTPFFWFRRNKPLYNNQSQTRNSNAQKKQKPNHISSPKRWTENIKNAAENPYYLKYWLNDRVKRRNSTGKVMNQIFCMGQICFLFGATYLQENRIPALWNHMISFIGKNFRFILSIATRSDLTHPFTAIQCMMARSIILIVVNRDMEKKWSEAHLLPQARGSWFLAINGSRFLMGHFKDHHFCSFQALSGRADGYSS